MGIKSINPFLKKISQRSFKKVDVSKFSGKRIAVDAGVLLYRTQSSARKTVIDNMNITEEIDEREVSRQFFIGIVRFITGWLNNNIVPVIVFDGPSREQKTETKKVRSEQREKQREKIEEIYRELEGDPFSLEDDVYDRLRKALKNHCDMGSGGFDMIKAVMESTGVPCLQAVHDAEELCSQLAREGKVAAVYTTDTDTYAYGAPLTIIGFSKSFGERSTMEVVVLETLLQDLEMTQDQFIDLCVMAGCDFNKNVPGVGVGKSYKLLRQYGSIEAIPLEKDCLNFEICRSIFRSYPLEGDYQLDLDRSKLEMIREVLDPVGASSEIPFLVASMNGVGEITDGSVNLRPPPIINIISR